MGHWEAEGKRPQQKLVPIACLCLNGILGLPLLFLVLGQRCPDAVQMSFFLSGIAEV